VTVLFDIAQSPSLTDAQRRRLLQRLASRLDSGGNLAVTVQESRSQHQNRELALARLQQLLAEALRPGKPRRKTRPTLASRERRLQAKRQRSETKQARRWRWS
jgi:ribosome-associated protein